MSSSSNSVSGWEEAPLEWSVFAFFRLWWRLRRVEVPSARGGTCRFSYRFCWKQKSAKRYQRVELAFLNQAIVCGMHNETAPAVPRKPVRDVLFIVLYRAYR
ncbi:hypothetical protein RvY_05977 [Ramazzottius varieornatus]|uniref:Uncharacterized protein n=1 Tax=Ramazzottius varieornatus TaxID=947166 RepID=A0A1D1UXG1_RAMVA|nr:hypothetical protein RvY_05977 [Ramazzottius varieornatus]